MLLGDIEGATKSYQWFEENCPDDIGEPFQYLCWALALYRSGNEKALGFIIGQVMKKSKGKANPKLVGEMLKRRLK